MLRDTPTRAGGQPPISQMPLGPCFGECVKAAGWASWCPDDGFGDSE